MMPTDRFERQLPVLLTELAEPRTPDYLDDLLWQTAHTSQRPAWSFIERWLPMVDITRQPVLAPRIPMRTIGLGLALIGLLLAAVAVALVGTRPPQPEPFGVARNGLVAFAADGDIFAADPISGASTAIVSGPETDLGPRYSLDGTHLVFERRVQGDSGPGQLFVTNSEGGALTLVTPDAPFVVGSYLFSPDGGEVMYTSLVDGISTISIARSDGSGVRTLDIGYAASDPKYRPPNGDEIVFVGQPRGPVSGLYAVRPDGNGLRTLVQPSNLVFAWPDWSPDGSRVAYTSWGVSGGLGLLAHVNIVSADGTAHRVLELHPNADLEGRPIWSNDGTRLLIQGCYFISADPADCETSFGIVSADGSDGFTQIDGGRVFPGASSGDAIQMWAPDDGSILSILSDESGQTASEAFLWDPTTGRSRPAPWSPAGVPSWQRLAP